MRLIANNRALIVRRRRHTFIRVCARRYYKTHQRPYYMTALRVLHVCLPVCPVFSSSGVLFLSSTLCNRSFSICIVCTVVPVSATGLGIVLGVSKFQLKKNNWETKRQKTNIGVNAA